MMRKKYLGKIAMCMLSAGVLWGGMTALSTPSAEASYKGGAVVMQAEKEIPTVIKMRGQYGHDADGFNLTMAYPVLLSMDNTEAVNKINQDVFATLQDIAQSYYMDTNGVDEIVESRDAGFDVKLNDGEFYSILGYQYNYYQGAAHPMYVVRGATYDIKTGKKLPWKKLVAKAEKRKFKLDAINEKLLREKRSQIFPDFKGLEKLPENYYLDENGVIHFIFQPYELGPYSSGMIDLAMD